MDKVVAMTFFFGLAFFGMLFCACVGRDASVVRMCAEVVLPHVQRAAWEHIHVCACAEKVFVRVFSARPESISTNLYPRPTCTFGDYKLATFAFTVTIRSALSWIMWITPNRAPWVRQILYSRSVAMPWMFSPFCGDHNKACVLNGRGIEIR